MHGMLKASGQISNTERKEETSLRRGKGEPETGRTAASKETHRMYKNHHKGKSQKANSLTSKRRKDIMRHITGKGTLSMLSHPGRQLS